MGKALYRKYRSKSLSEIVGQEHITRTLEQALKTGRISHAYLFTGPRGVGKTSIARILAHEINKLPYTDDSMHMDIIEIDAASNRRIDEIRDLRDKIHIAPTSAKYKVYIIDEVHMLTREAFNALLKTLEEPPEHAVFILATTEAHKLPETIVSRTQRYSFRPVDEQQVVTHLTEIAQKEGIDIDQAALQHIARAGEGSFRDSISLLDQASSLPSPVNEQAIQTLLGIVPAVLLEQLIAALASATTSKQVLGAVNELYSQGYQAPQISHQLIGGLRQSLLDDTLQLPLDKTLTLIDALLSVPAAHNPERQLEVILLSNATALQAGAPVAQQLVPPPEMPPAAPQKVVAIPDIPIEEPKPMAKPRKAATQKPADEPDKPALPTHDIDDQLWPKIIDRVRKQYYTLYSVLKTAEPVFKDGELELGFDFAFHQKRINDPKNKAIIATVIEELTGKNMSITCIKLAADRPKKTTTKAAATTPPSITDIFGGGELLES